MKLITANKLKRLWNNGFVPKLLEKLDKTRVLTSTEQVQANTNAENVVGALVAKELINDLAQQPEFVYDATGKITGYKTPGGADTVFPFRNVLEIQGTVPNANTSNSSYQIPLTYENRKLIGISKLVLGNSDIQYPEFTINNGLIKWHDRINYIKYTALYL